MVSEFDLFDIVLVDNQYEATICGIDNMGKEPMYTVYNHKNSNPFPIPCNKESRMKLIKKYLE